VLAAESVLRGGLDETTGNPYFMEDDDFEWDDAKAAKNLADHGVSFETAARAFDDAFAIEWQDERESYDEDRFILLGMVDERILFVVFSVRNGRTRIISARGAEPREKRKYHEENSQ
jgi:uncharacterized protein